MIPDELIRLKNLHEEASNELTEDEIRTLAKHEHPGVRGLLLCMHRDGEIILPADLLDELIRKEKDPLNLIEIQEIQSGSRNTIDNVTFPIFNN